MSIHTEPPCAGGCHACAFFDGGVAAQEAMLSFTRDCQACDERCLHFMEGAQMAQRSALLGTVVDVQQARAAGRLELRAWTETYLRESRFDVDAMLGLASELLREPSRGTGRLRVWADMEWSLSGLPGCEDLVEYESRLNEVLEGRQAMVVCVYDLQRYGAGLLLDVLSAHPVVLAGGMLRPNPLYVPTGCLLPAYRARRAAAARRATA